MRTVGLYTLGCKVSQYETEAIAEAFEDAGFCVVPFSERADVYVINTCTVTAESDRKSRQFIRRAVALNPNALVMVTGCYSQVSPDEIAKIKGVTYIGGTERKLLLPKEAVRLLAEKEAGKEWEQVIDSRPICHASFENMQVRGAPRTRAYVKIEDGCECRCAYCAIPGARGNVRSKEPQDVLREVNALAENGTKEIVLTGIEIASYGKDLSSFGLCDLLELLEREGAPVRLRLGSITPEIMQEAFVSRLAKCQKVVPHFHISMQSGSDAVLAGMKRRYNAEMALAAITRLRDAIPSVQFTTDIMTGFPGETEKEFLETVVFCEKASFLDMHVFAYSKRKNTPAALYENQVPQEEKKRRSAVLIDLAARMKEENLARIISRASPISVLFETKKGTEMLGHSAEFAEVCVESEADLHGEIRSVMPTYQKNGILYGNLLCD